SAASVRSRGWAAALGGGRVAIRGGRLLRARPRAACGGQASARGDLPRPAGDDLGTRARTAGGAVAPPSARIGRSRRRRAAGGGAAAGAVARAPRAGAR